MNNLRDSLKLSRWLAFSLLIYIYTSCLVQLFLFLPCISCLMIVTSSYFILSRFITSIYSSHISHGNLVLIAYLSKFNAHTQHFYPTFKTKHDSFVLYHFQRKKPQYSTYVIFSSPIPSSLHILIASSFPLLQVILQSLVLRMYPQPHILHYFHNKRAH